MLLILSEHTDSVSDTVCGWLNHIQIPFLRINKDDSKSYLLRKVLIKNNGEIDILFSFKNVQYSLDNFSDIWCRRGRILIPMPDEKQINSGDKILTSKVMNHLNQEKQVLLNFIYAQFKRKVCVSNPLEYNLNKLVVLQKAQKIGLKIPDTLITNTAQDALAFLSSSKSIITKNIFDQLFIYDAKNKIQIGQITERITKKELMNRKHFFHSLFQKKSLKNMN